MAFVYICLQSLIHYFGFAVWNKGTQGNAYPLFPVINKHNYTSTISVVIYRCLYYKIDTNCLQLDSIKNNVPLPVSQCFFQCVCFYSVLHYTCIFTLIFRTVLAASTFHVLN